VATIEFQNYDDRYKMTSEEVEDAVRSLEPDVIQSLAVFVNGRWWPAKQPFVAAAKRQNKNIQNNSHINSRTALRLLSRLGFPTHDTATQGPLPDVPTRGSANLSQADRRLALQLAVQLRGGQPTSAGEVTGLADELAAWLTEGRP
jgi:hypothetical protein